MIEGVETKKLKVAQDDRGFLMEMLRCDDPIFESFGQVYITGCKEGIAKAWHYHKKQTDHFVCVYGKTLVVLYDGRQDSATYKTVEEFVLESPPSKRAVLLKIPPMVIHGFTALNGAEAGIINIPDFPYQYSTPDELRYPWNTPEIPYKWPPSVKSGG